MRYRETKMAARLSTELRPYEIQGAQFTLEDGSGQSREVPVCSGKLKWIETVETITFVGRHDECSREGDDHPMSLSFLTVITDRYSKDGQTLDGWLRIPPGSWESMNLISTLGAGRDMRLHLDVWIAGDKLNPLNRIMRFSHCKFLVDEGPRQAIVTATCMASAPRLRLDRNFRPLTW